MSRRTVVYAAAVCVTSVAACFAAGAAIALHLYDRVTRRST